MKNTAVILKLFLLSLATATLLISCTKKKMVQSSGSMNPTIKVGETIQIDTAAYNADLPERWDVIVFESPKQQGHWCSRIIGLPGEVINLTSVGLTIDGAAVNPSSLFAPPAYKLPKKTPGVTTIEFPYTIPKACYFVMGDNVSDSLDSRYWGGLEAPKIIGKVHGK
jgi:signal peptidase I